MALVLYGVEIKYPFEKRSVLAAVKVEISIRHHLKAKGFSDSRILEEIQIRAKDFYLGLQQAHGPESVNEFISLFVLIQTEYLQLQKHSADLGKLRFVWANMGLIMAALAGSFWLVGRL